MRSTILAFLIIGIGLLLWARVGTAGVGIDINGNPVIVPDSTPPVDPEKEKRDKQRFEWEKQDRQDKKKQQEAAENAAKEQRTQAAYAESRRERVAKSKRRAKAEGRKKPYNSWQLQNR